MTTLIRPLSSSSSCQSGRRRVSSRYRSMADAPAHADDHRLAVHGLGALLEMRDDVSGHQPDALLGSDHRFELRPSGLELLLAVDLLAFGRLLEAGVDPGPLALVERELGESALVVDRYRRLVLDGALDVVDADVVAEHGPGVGVLELDRRTGEADERCVGHGCGLPGSILRGASACERHRPAHRREDSGSGGRERLATPTGTSCQHSSPEARAARAACRVRRPRRSRAPGTSRGRLAPRPIR